MAIPKAEFTFEPQLDLSVKFADRSTGSPTTWLWEFGFEGEGPVTSEDQNPTVEFPAAGVYNVKLTASNVDGSSIKQWQLLVRPEYQTGLSVYEMVKYGLPEGIVADDMIFGQSLKKWQIYLHKLLTPPIADADMFNQAAWPFEANTLIAKLIVYDKIVLDSGKAMMSLVAGGSTKGGLKKMEMGPSVAEWYNSSDFWKGIMQPGGILDLVKAEICFIAGGLGVSLVGICSAPNKVMGFVIARNSRRCC